MRLGEHDHARDAAAAAELVEVVPDCGQARRLDQPEAVLRQQFGIDQEAIFAPAVVQIAHDMETRGLLDLLKRLRLIDRKNLLQLEITHLTFLPP